MRTLATIVVIVVIVVLAAWALGWFGTDTTGDLVAVEEGEIEAGAAEEDAEAGVEAEGVE